MLDVVWFTLKLHNGFRQTYKQARQISLLTSHDWAFYIHINISTTDCKVDFVYKSILYFLKFAMLFHIFQIHCGLNCIGSQWMDIDEGNHEEDGNALKLTVPI